MAELPLAAPAASDSDPDRGVSPSVWRFARASRAHVVVDAAAYFDLMRDAMLLARQRIMMVGWDFDTRIHLGGGRRWWNLPHRARYPARLGAFVMWLGKRRRRLRVKVLKWNFGAMKFVLRGSMILDLARWWWSRHVDFRFDGAHPLGCSHHQKLVVIDENFAACGGIDMTSDRWDTPDHLEHDPRRLKPSGKPYPPWHDVSMLVEGDAAAALGELGRLRWRQSGGETLPPCGAQADSAWPERLRAEFSDVDIGISRTRAGWRDCGEVREIEALFVEHIARARRFIYAESQYFASRRVAEAIAARLAEPDPPEIVLINPLTADGWLQQQAMDTARVRLMHALEGYDRADRFRVYYPVTSGGTPIYVHAKLMIVDDEILRVGSANMNNRSMGLDSECDVFMDAARPGNGHIVPAITALRHRLLAEHTGQPDSLVSERLATGIGMAALIDSLPRTGKHLEAFALRPLTDAEKAIADTALLDAERPEEIFEPMARRRGLFRRGGLLRRPE
ncbi:MAG: phospholipase [Sphingomonadales bacterium]|nr:phospholipase [Sphingomonadales bacterium]